MSFISTAMFKVDASLCQRLDSRQLTQITSAEGARKMEREARVLKTQESISWRRKVSVASLSPEAQEIPQSRIDF